jgi:hypothetical protein
MGMRMPETCWAVFKRKTVNLRNCCIWLVDSFECLNIICVCYSQLYRSASFNSSGRSSTCDTADDMYSDISLEEDMIDLNHKVSKSYCYFTELRNGT